VKGFVGYVWLDVFGPEAVVQDRLCGASGISRVLEAEDAGELMRVPGDGEVESFLAEDDVVDVGVVDLMLVVDTENGRAIGPSILLPGGDDLPVSGEVLQVVVDDVNGIFEVIEESFEEGVRFCGIGEEHFPVVAQVAQAGPDVNSNARIFRGCVRGISHQFAADEPLDEAIAFGRTVSLPEDDGRHLSLRQSQERIWMALERGGKVGFGGCPGVGHSKNDLRLQINDLRLGQYWIIYRPFGAIDVMS
jgi:hypothetical protein